MNNSKTIAIAASAFGLALLFSRAAPAQPARASVHVRGTIQNVSGSLMTVTSATGPVRVLLSPAIPVVSLVRASRAQVKPGSFIGITSVAGPNGTQRAVEIHVFPESMRGSGEGTRPWDWPGTGKGHSRMTNGTIATGSRMTNGTVAPRSRMTNGTVGRSNASGALTVTYKSGTGSGAQTITFPPGIPIVTFAPGNRSDLHPGAHVFVIGAPAPGNAVKAARIVVGKDGVTPPM